MEPWYREQANRIEAMLNNLTEVSNSGEIDTEKRIQQAVRDERGRCRNIVFEYAGDYKRAIEQINSGI